MKQQKFTQGLWSRTGAGEIITLSPQGTYMKIGDVKPYQFTDGSGEHKITAEEAKANGQLISAAPNMFSLLESMLLRCAAGTIKLSSGDIDEIEYALNKATGDV